MAPQTEYTLVVIDRLLFTKSTRVQYAIRHIWYGKLTFVNTMRI